MDGLSHVGARVNSCMALVIARHRVEKNHRLTQVLFVCLRCLVSASEHIWHISSHCASLQSTGAVLGVAQRNGRPFTGMPEANACICCCLVGGKRPSLGWRQLVFSDDASYCSSSVHIRGRSHVVAGTRWSLCSPSHVFMNTFSFSCGHEHVLLRCQAGT